MNSGETASMLSALLLQLTADKNTVELSTSDLSQASTQAS